MATKIYDHGTVELIDGTQLYLTPLKIKYLREFMEAFELVKSSKNDDDTLYNLINCTAIAMKQYYPSIKTIEDVEDNFDIQAVYRIIDLAAGIKMNGEDNDDKPASKKTEDSDSSWNTLDLAKLEAEVFLLGIWKDYEDLETSLSMPELVATLESKRDLDYQEKKFLAAIQGVDLDSQTGKSDPWEEMKARVFSGGSARDSNDILALQGQNAANAGFGIGMGLDYERID